MNDACHDDNHAGFEQLDERLDIFFREIELAIKWQRPSILLAVYPSAAIHAEVEAALENKIIDFGQQVMHVRGEEDTNPDLSRFISQVPDMERVIFFVDGLSCGSERDGISRYRALNVSREYFVEKQIRIVFWLTESEAVSLAHYAPDFWASRHRVIDFIESQQPDEPFVRVLESAWQGQGEEKHMTENLVDTHAKISLRETTQAGLPEWDGSTTAGVNLLLTLGIMHWRKGDHEKADESLHSALDIAIKTQDKRLEAICFNAIALVKSDLGLLDEAVEAYEQAIELAPEKTFIWGHLGNLYTRLGQYPEAVEAFLNTLEHNPVDSVVWNNLGNAYVQVGQIDEAIDAYRKALELNERYIEPWMSLGTLFSQQDLAGDAVKAYQRATEIDPNNARAWNELGDIYFELNACADAIQAYTVAIKLGVETGRSYSNLAFAYARQEEFTSAIPVYLRSIELFETDAEKAVAWNRLGDVYRQVKEYESAISAYQHADTLADASGSAAQLSYLDGLVTDENGVEGQLSTELLDQVRQIAAAGEHVELSQPVLDGQETPAGQAEPEQEASAVPLMSAETVEPVAVSEPAVELAVAGTDELVPPEIAAQQLMVDESAPEPAPASQDVALAEAGLPEDPAIQSAEPVNAETPSTPEPVAEPVAEVEPTTPAVVSDEVVPQPLAEDVPANAPVEVEETVQPDVESPVVEAVAEETSPVSEVLVEVEEIVQPDVESPVVDAVAEETSPVADVLVVAEETVQPDVESLVVDAVAEETSPVVDVLVEVEETVQPDVESPVVEAVAEETSPVADVLVVAEETVQPDVESPVVEAVAEETSPVVDVLVEVEETAQPDVESPVVEAVAEETNPVSEVLVEVEETVKAAVEFVSEVVETLVTAVVDQPDDAVSAEETPLALEPDGAPVAEISTPETDLQNARIWNELGNIYFKVGAYDEALDAYNKAIELGLQVGLLYSNLGFACAHQGKHAEAIPLYEKSIELLEDITDRALTWSRLGDAYGRTDQVINALAAYENALEIDPTNVSFLDGLNAIRSQLVGHAAQPEAEVSLAETPEIASQPAEQLDEPAIPADLVVVVAAADEDDDDDLELVSDEQGSDDAVDSAVVGAVARMFEEQPIPELASDAGDMNSPEDAPLAEAPAEDNTPAPLDQPVAEEAPDQSAALEETTAIAEPVLAEETAPEAASVAEPELAEQPAADDDLAVAQNPAGMREIDLKNAHIWNELGHIFARAGNFNDATDAYNKAIELDPAFAWPYSNLGLVHAQQGLFGEAIPCYQKSIELFDDHKDKAISWNRLGDAYRQLNEYANAIAAYQIADELNQHDVDNASPENLREIDLSQAAPIFSYLYGGSNDRF